MQRSRKPSRPPPAGPAPVRTEDAATRLAAAIAAAIGLAEADAVLLREYLQAIDRLERDVHALRAPTGQRGTQAHEGPQPWIEPHA